MRDPASAGAHLQDTRLSRRRPDSAVQCQLLCPVEDPTKLRASATGAKQEASVTVLISPCLSWLDPDAVPAR